MAEKAFAPLAGRDRVNEIGSAVSTRSEYLVYLKGFFNIFFKQNYL